MSMQGQWKQPDHTDVDGWIAQLFEGRLISESDVERLCEKVRWDQERCVAWFVVVSLLAPWTECCWIPATKDRRTLAVVFSFSFFFSFLESLLLLSILEWKDRVWLTLGCMVLFWGGLS